MAREDEARLDDEREIVGVHHLDNRVTVHDGDARARLVPVRQAAGGRGRRSGEKKRREGLSVHPGTGTGSALGPARTTRR